MKPRWWLWFGLYGIVVIAIVLLMGQARRNALRRLSGVAAQEEWNAWRDEAQRQAAGNGPVLRRAPRSEEPPSLVLLRDHFSTILMGVLFLTTALFLTFAFMILGVFKGPQFEVGQDDSHDRGVMMEE